MSPVGNAERTLKDALKGSVKENAMQVAITEESRVLLQAVLREEMATAVSNGIRQAMTKEAAQQFATVFIDVMKAQASVKVDTWAGALVKGVMKKLWDNVWIITFAIAFAYSVGGFGAVLALGKWGVHEALK